MQQARRLGAEILVTRDVARLDPTTREVHLDGDDVVRARTVILATGVTWRRLAINGFDRLIGKGIYYGAARSEASATHGLDVYLIGAGNSSGQAALYFANHARTVTLVVRGDSLEKSMSRYRIEQLAGQLNEPATSHPTQVRLETPFEGVARCSITESCIIGDPMRPLRIETATSFVASLDTIGKGS